MNDALRTIVWRQFGAAIDMLENAIGECPDEVWHDRVAQPEYWYVAYHTLFWLDLYLHGPVETYAPPPPFGLEELDPAGLMPERVYAPAELLAWLGHSRNRLRAVVSDMDEAAAAGPLTYVWGQTTVLELLLYNMRHVQHHAAQLNLLLRHRTDAAPRWVGVTRKPMTDNAR